MSLGVHGDLRSSMGKMVPDLLRQFKSQPMPEAIFALVCPGLRTTYYAPWMLARKGPGLSSWLDCSGNGDERYQERTWLKAHDAHAESLPVPAFIQKLKQVACDLSNLSFSSKHSTAKIA